ncbi:YqhR family membrane protein [Fictibacillus terranigra]|uniref:YqhR family membrane protein n=1 Tax=Fictibacillus terranigra TaxID=3058424 RepID=A0ABT8E9W8_9BACL|nr:YqhR family membrane protein [Fictibacillus sp. CENA-BCM004]MDN4074713.1 YqhR family membrane protein [Fictibacillus sp. CENA-BCM004]
MNDFKQDKNKRDEAMSFMARVVSVGFFGGLFWGIVGYFAYYLNLSKIGPALILAPWALGKWKSQWLGQLIGVIAISLISILVAICYRYLLSRVKSMVGGLTFGILLWVIVFYLLHPIFPGLEPISQLGRNTIATTLCLYILYGVFVGYSISFEYQELQSAQSRENT